MMKISKEWRFISSSEVVFVVLVWVGVVVLLLSLLSFPFGLGGVSRSFTPKATNIIVAENAHPGTTSWKIPSGKGAFTQIQAYASLTSVLTGQTLTFYVSTLKEGTHYSIDVYRLGWYQGLGGRLMTSIVNQIGHAQGYYDVLSHRLVGCDSCLVDDTTTGLVDANWQPSYALIVPPNWTTGIYLAKFTDAGGYQTYVPFDVRGNSSSLYAVVTSDTTYAAYNRWGGYSLYAADTPINGLQRGVKVSFNRPYVDAWGSSQVLSIEANAIHWLERQGYDLSYMSSVDLHEDSAQLLHHRAYLSLGHDEYWTNEMRDGVEYARASGIGLAFLGANAVYWQMRFEPDSAGTPDRTIVCYKVQTNLNDLARDPLYGQDNTRVTARWRDSLLARPENALIGVMYSNYLAYSTTQRMRGFPWQVSYHAKSALLKGTGLEPGQLYGCDLVGYEWDRVFANGATPLGLEVLAESPVENAVQIPDVSDTTDYTASSGALVFATGSVYWATALDNYRLYPDIVCGDHSEVLGLQKLMAHVMDALVVRHVSGHLT